MKDAAATITLDIRKQKKDGTFPIKIYVWQSSTKKGKFYGTKLSIATGDFHSAWETVKPRKLFQPLRERLQKLQTEAQAAIDALENFSFEAYERKAAIPKSEAMNVFYHYAQKIEELKAAKQVGTASNYEMSFNAIRKYHSEPKLNFKTVTPKFLQGFEDFMVNNDRSLTTVSMYLRALRTIYNDAIAAKYVDVDSYPFGRRKYVVPASKNTKKALTPLQLAALRDAKANTPDQERARAFFFFSYASNGMNMKDIALMKWEQLEADRLTFIRAKTKRTKKEQQKAITVFLTDFHRDIIAQYATKPSFSDYVFPIITGDMDAEQQHGTIKNFTSYVNQHLRKLCKANDLQKTSTMWARHSFATVAVLKGASMEFMRESLGHSDMKTTLNYFAGFDDEAKKELAVSIMDF